MTNQEIKAWCKANKVTQAELAESIGYSEISLRTSLNSNKNLIKRMYDAIHRFIESRENKDMSVTLTEEKKLAIQKKARAIGRSVEQLILDSIGEALGVDLSELASDIRLENWDDTAEKKSKGYTIDEGDGYLEAAEEGEGGS